MQNMLILAMDHQVNRTVQNLSRLLPGTGRKIRTKNLDYESIGHISDENNNATKVAENQRGAHVPKPSQRGKCTKVKATTTRSRPPIQENDDKQSDLWESTAIDQLENNWGGNSVNLME